MRIGIDAREIKNPYSGTGMYVINLIRTLAKIDSQNAYVLFINKNKKLNFKLPNNFEYFNLSNTYFTKIQDQVLIPLAIARSKVEIFHVTHHDVTPFLSKVPLIVTVLDVVWLDYPGKRSNLFQKYYYYLTKNAVTKAKEIITISESTKKRVLYYFPFCNKKIESILIACDPAFNIHTNNISNEKVLKEFKIQKPYILYVGSFASRKNIKTLIQSMKLLWKGKSFSIPLIIAGKPSGKDDYLFNDLLKEYPIILINRSLTNLELKSLYQNAKIFVFPSIYEGFGLPVLEAMSCGCPVLASNATSIPEIISDSEFLFEPKDKKQLAKKIFEIISNEKIHSKYKDFVYKKSKNFSWTRTATKTKLSYLKLKKFIN